MNITLEQFLVANSLVSLASHSFLGIRWLYRRGMTAERKAVILLHAKNGHQSRLKHCQEADCVLLTQKG